MAQLLDGPVLAPKSGTTRQLVVFLHGYGADGGDLIGIGREWSDFLPDCLFLAPNGPEPCASGQGRQWFSLYDLNPRSLLEGSEKARPILDAFLKQKLSVYNLSADALALVGFSQGTMMALHTGLRLNEAPAAVLGFSGLLVGAEQLSQIEPKSLPILLSHGDQDTIIPLGEMFYAADALAQAGYPCQWHLAYGIGHGIDAKTIENGGLFLQQSFKRSVKSRQSTTKSKHD